MFIVYQNLKHFQTDQVQHINLNHLTTCGNPLFVDPKTLKTKAPQDASLILINSETKETHIFVCAGKIYSNCFHLMSKIQKMPKQKKP